MSGCPSYSPCRAVLRLDADGLRSVQRLAQRAGRIDPVQPHFGTYILVPSMHDATVRASLHASPSF